MLASTVCFSAPLPKRINQVLRLLPDIKNDPSGLLKTAQGLTPANQSPASFIPIENMTGLKETITQHWEDYWVTIPEWLNSVRDVYTFNDQGDLAEVTGYVFKDTTQTWVYDYRVAFTYHTKSKVASQTSKYYSNGQWFMSSLVTVEYNEVDSPASFASFEWDSVLTDWDSIPMIAGDISYGANGKMSMVIASYNYSGQSGYVFFYLQLLS